MKVTINGKELSAIEKREQECFESVKTAAYIYLGGVCLLCGALLYDLAAAVLDHFGAGSIVTAFTDLLQK